MKKTIKILSLILALIFCLSVLAGCLEDEEDPEDTKSEVSAKTGDGTWTVFLYLCGTDLESEGGAATSNLEEIFNADLGDKVNYVIQTGGTSEWLNDIINPEKLQRYIVEDGSLVLVDEQELASMGSSDTLSAFLKWGVENYPADNYMVNFWNHGGGSASGVEFDELYENDSLTLVEIEEGIAAAGVQFELIGFDTCLMATIETAYLLSSHANYMVASEEYEPGGGWDYTSWLNYLGSNTECSGADLGKEICNSYYAKCESSGEGDMATLSVIDLSKIPALYEAFKSMSSEIVSVSEDVTSFTNLSKGASKAENYGGNTEDEGYTNMVDLGDLASKTSGVLTETYDAVISAINAAVVYQIKGSNRESANGISVFYPLSNEIELLDGYAEITDNVDYLRFIDALAENWNAPDWVYSNAEKIDSVSSSEYSVSLSAYVDEDSYFTLSIDSGYEIVQDLAFEFMYYDLDNDEIYDLGSDYNFNYDEDNDVYKDNFSGNWLTIGGCYCSTNLIYSSDDYLLYSIPVMLNDEITNLRVVYDYETEAYYILGAYDGVDASTGMSSRDIKQLKDGDEITFLCDVYDSTFESCETASIGTITYTSDTVIEDGELFDGYYLYRYKVTDIFGEVTYSEYVVMECSEGYIYVSTLDE